MHAEGLRESQERVVCMEGISFGRLLGDSEMMKKAQQETNSKFWKGSALNLNSSYAIGHRNVLHLLNRSQFIISHPVYYPKLD